MIDRELSAIFDRRSVLLISGGLIMTSILVMRMVQLQVFSHKHYKKLSDNNYLRIQPILPERGKMLDMNNEIIVTNKPTYRVYIIPKETTDQNGNVSNVIDRLTRELKLNARELKRINEKIEKQRSFVPTLVRENLTWEQMAELQSLREQLPGLHVEQGFTRMYPNGNFASHAIGYVGDVSESDIKKRFDSMMEAPYFKTGKYGIERRYDPLLRGTAGRNVFMVDALGRVIEDFSSDAMPAIRGTDLKLTINSAIQKQMERALEPHTSGASVVIDIKTGGILAMTSTPSFNPQLFQGENSESHLTELQNNPYKPFLNKCIEGAYPPGSTFKIVVALAALETGAITPTEKIYCDGGWNYGTHRYHCWEKDGHGWQNLSDALAHSCDVYFYQVALRVGIDAIRNMAKRLGMGQTLLEDLLGEHPGLLPDKRWKEKNVGQTWRHADTILTGIGQGFVLSTPLQLAIMTARAVSGREIMPTLMMDSTSRNEFPSIGISQKHIDAVMHGLNRVTTTDGTASLSAINVNGQKMGGKTGTSQVRRITTEERATGVRSSASLPYHLRNHAMFVGYAPTENPRYAISVLLEHGNSGSIAGHVAASIMRETLKVMPND